MAFRTVIVDTHSKLEYSLNYLVFRTVDETKRILLDEIHTLIIQSTEVALTTSLISELTKRKIKVIFCDAKHNPESELIPCYGSHNSFRRITNQIGWQPEIKGAVWQKIVQEKILNQSRFLKEKGQLERAEMLDGFAKEVVPHDATNREGHAAKVYFNGIFFEGFTREKDCPINAALDYGYTILLSQFNREIVAAGYLTQLGIHHIGETNPFNLSCDFIEPFRILVDRKASALNEEDPMKPAMIALLSDEVEIDGKKQTVANAITIYCQSLFRALNDGDIGGIRFPIYGRG